MRRGVLQLLLVGLMTLSLACAGGGGSGSNAPSPSSRTRITSAELQGMVGASALSAVTQLRPTWLEPRGRSNNAPLVFYGNVRRGSLQILRSLQASAVREMRYIDETDARARWGTEYGITSPVIQVVLR